MVLSKLYKVFLVVFLCGTSFCVLAQSKRANIWYFGERTGMDFNFSPPKVLTNSALNTHEGTASMCDKNGDMLFYTDGVRVFGRDHKIMSNGTGLSGSSSSTQSAVIVPSPSNPNIYYIFTTSNGSPTMNRYGNFSYSIVDMSLYGGKGGIILKNIFLNTQATEKLTAVRHHNGKDVWVITHQALNNKFYVYKVTVSGVIATPIISNVGVVHSKSANGALKVSPDGSKLVSAELQKSIVELFDFNNETGRVSNPVVLTDERTSQVGLGYYGVEFSPSSRFVYISNESLIDGRILQYDVNLNNPTAISNSETIIYDNKTYRNGALQLAPNGKIYLSYVENVSTVLLGSINNPNEKGLASNFTLKSITIDSTRTHWGLPNFVQSTFFSVKVDCDYIPPPCDDLKVEFYNTGDTLAILSSNWDFGDGTNGVGIRLTKKYLKHGAYSVSNNVLILVSGDTITKKKVLTVTTFPKPQLDFDVKEVCIGDLVYFDNTTSIDSIKSWYWDFGDGTSSQKISPYNNYQSIGGYTISLNAEAYNGCRDSLTRHFPNLVNPIPKAYFENYFIDNTEELRVGFTNFSTNGDSYLWDFGDGVSSTSFNPDKVYNDSGTYTTVLTATSKWGCVDSFSKPIKVFYSRPIFIPNAFTPNGDGLNNTFGIETLNGIKELDMKIFSRWGEQIFQSNNLSERWNGYYKGELVPDGAYLYLIRIVDYSNKLHIYKGTVTVIK